ncbi:MAG: type II secretion system F family protein [Deltaproteobacteria bacterium]
MATAAAAKAAPKEKKKAAPTWIWKGVSKEGQERQGEMQAEDADSVQQRLRQMGINPSKVKKKPMDLKLPSLGGVPRKSLIVFTRQLATMIDAGLPLVQCLDILHGQQDNAAFKKALGEIKDRVEAGSTFADALREQPKVFDELYRELVAAGEVGGILDTILNRLVVYIEKAAKLAGKVKGAMVYPSIVLVVGVGVTVILMVVVTPTFEKMFKDFGGTLPGPTQVVVDLSHFMVDNGVKALVGLVAAIFGIGAALRTEKGTRILHKILLRMPIIGDVVRKTAVARFTRTLGTMISSGVPIMDALNVVAKTAGNKVVEEAILHVRSKVGEGKNIAQPLAETKVFPSMVVQMIGVGEATGAMDQMLSKIADFYDEEVDAAVAAMTAAIEPIMMVFLGGVVGGFLIAMYLPIFTIASAIK